MSNQNHEDDLLLDALSLLEVPPLHERGSSEVSLLETRVGRRAGLHQKVASHAVGDAPLSSVESELDVIELLHLPGERTFVAQGTLKAGRYPLGSLLGEGGMGLVYTARDEALGRLVALKTLRPEDADNHAYRRALTFEARLTGQLEHPNIVPVHELGVLEDGRPFYTMKLVGQTSLQDVLYQLRMKRPLATQHYTRPRLLQLFRGICMAVEYAHARGVVHRDLKPDNVLIGDYGEVQILDWGVARVLPHQGRPGYFAGQIEEEGVVIGTPHYMSPEQACGDTQLVDARSDVYSLGIVLYQLLTHTLPFENEATVEQLEKVLNAPIEPPSQRAPELAIPGELEAICMQALCTERDQRYRSARALWEAIERFLEGERDIARRQGLAAALYQEGSVLKARYYTLHASLGELEHSLRESEGSTALLVRPDERQHAWEIQLRVQEQQLLIARVFAESVSSFHRVLTHVPTHEQALSQLYELYQHWSEVAKRRGDWSQAILYADLARTLMPQAPQAKGTLHIRSYPDGAQSRVLQLSEHGAVEVFSGTTPVNELELTPGSYLIAVSLPGHAERRTTLIVEAARVSRVLLTLPAWDSALATLSHSEELAGLTELFGRSVRSQRLVVAYITGEAGLGKGRLLDDFSVWLERSPQPYTYSAVRLSGIHQSIPFFALSEILAHRAGITRNISESAVFSKLFSLLRDLRSETLNHSWTPQQRAELQRDAELLASLPPLRRSYARPPPSATRLEQLFELLLGALRLLATRAPVVIVLRGAEHLDPLSRAMFWALREELQDSPIFLVLVARDLSARSPGDYDIGLTPLSAERMTQQLASILNGPASKELVELVQRLSQGNAFLVIEIARLLLRRNYIAPTPQGWRPTLARMPESFDALLREELEALPPVWRSILEAAAVQGSTFWSERLDLPLLAPNDVAEALKALCDQEWIQARPVSRYPNLHEYSFKHDSFQRVLLNTVAAEPRQREHLRFAHWLSSQQPRSLEDLALAIRHANTAGARELERKLSQILLEESLPWGDPHVWFRRHRRSL